MPRDIHPADLIHLRDLRPDQFLRNLEELIRFLKWRMKKLTAKATNWDELQRNCCGYLITQIDRMKKYETAPIEELASICRNIFELIVTVKYYGTNDADAGEFLLQADDDHVIIDEGLAEWVKAVDDPNSPFVQDIKDLYRSKYNRHPVPP